jgi:hypothetical protein
MKILFIGQNPNSGLKDSDPTSLQSTALEMGHSLALTLSEFPDLVICVDWLKSCGGLVKKANSLGIPTVLVKNEPSIVTTEHGDRRTDSKFTAIVEVGRPNYLPLVRCPQTWNSEYFDSSPRINRAVAISANKFSFVRGQQYSLRAKVYSNSNLTDLYGFGWDRSGINNVLKLAKELQIAVLGRSNKITFACLASFRLMPLNFIGQAGDKLEVLSRYKVSVVIENSSEYMSEKLIDSILAGTIPVYVGPPVEIFGIPPGLVVEANPNLQDVLRAVTLANSMPYGDWHDLAAGWLNAPETQKSWSAHRAMSQIIDIVGSVSK